MMPSLLQILREVWRARVDHFLAVYVLMTGTAAIAVAWVAGRRSVPIPEQSRTCRTPNAAGLASDRFACRCNLGGVHSGRLSCHSFEVGGFCRLRRRMVHTLFTQGPQLRTADLARQRTVLPTGRSRIQLDTSPYDIGRGIPCRIHSSTLNCLLHSTLSK